MAKVFVSGFVSDTTIHGPMRGLDVRASVSDGSERHVLWQGTTDARGAFGFEVRPTDYPTARALVAEVHRGGARLAETEVAWHTLEPAGTHIDFAIDRRVLHAHGEPLSLPFPIGFPGADRPLGQRGPVQLELDRPGVLPEHPMAALPFLLQMSRPLDPAEAEVGNKEELAAADFAVRRGPIGDPP